MCVCVKTYSFYFWSSVIQLSSGSLFGRYVTRSTSTLLSYVPGNSSESDEAILAFFFAALHMSDTGGAIGLLRCLGHNYLSYNYLPEAYCCPAHGIDSGDKFPMVPNSNQLLLPYNSRKVIVDHQFRRVNVFSTQITRAGLAPEPFTLDSITKFILCSFWHFFLLSLTQL